MTDLFVMAVELVYGAASNPGHWPQALQAIADCFGDVGTILIYGRDDGRFGIITSPALQAMVEEYGRDWSHRDIRAIRARERGYFLTRDVITDRDVISPEEFDTNPQYTQFLAKHGLKYFAAAGVSPDPHVEVALSVQRRIDKPQYSEAELATLGRLALHVEKSLRLSIRLIDAELLKEGLGEALAHLAIGVFALNSLGRVVFSNQAGQKMLGDGLQVRDGRLSATVAADQNALETAIECLTRADSAHLIADVKPVLAHGRKANRPLVIYVLPVVTMPDSPEWIIATARAIVLVTDPDRTDAADPSLVRDVLGLTLGEARVAAIVGSGLGPRKAAEKLGISENTVRSVLKNVFSKAGVSRQSELVALMSKLALLQHKDGTSIDNSRG